MALAGMTALLGFLLGEDWSRWQGTGVAHWPVFGVFSLGVLLGANMGQIGALLVSTSDGLAAGQRTDQHCSAPR